MKKFLLTIVAIALGVSGWSQLTFDKDTATLILEAGVSHKATIKLTNNSGHDIDLKWTLISSTLNDNDDGDSDNSNNWVLQFCECNTCYTNDFSELPIGAQCSDPMSYVFGANSIDWYLTVNPNGQPMVDAEWVIEVENLTDGIKDTLTYLILGDGSVPSNEMTYEPQMSYTELTANQLEEGKIKITNNWDHGVQLSWKMISSTIKDFGDPDGAWFAEFCDCVTCYDNSSQELIKLNTCTGLMAPNASKEWILKINPGTVAITNAEWVIEVFNHTDNVKDTIYYFLIDHPNSVIEVLDFGTVKNYPNPTNNEMVVEYALTNVSSPVLSVYNVIGSKLASYPMTGLNGRMRVNTSSLNNGLYFYTIEEQGQRVFIQKFNVVH